MYRPLAQCKSRRGRAGEARGAVCAAELSITAARGVEVRRRRQQQGWEKSVRARRGRGRRVERALGWAGLGWADVKFCLRAEGKGLALSRGGAGAGGVGGMVVFGFRSGGPRLRRGTGGLGCCELTYLLTVTKGGLGRWVCQRRVNVTCGRCGLGRCGGRDDRTLLGAAGETPARQARGKDAG